MPTKKGKTSLVTVVVQDKFTTNVPRGEARQKLATSGKMQKWFTRDMSSVQVESKIKSVFNLLDYTVLESDSSGHTLCKCSDQELDVKAVVGCKGCLYPCKEFSQVRM